MQKSPMPEKSASEAFIGAPVSARKSPARPGSRLRNQLPPTSGKRPMLISGMAMRVSGVTTRCEAPASRPRPPPMTMPCPQQSTGFVQVWMR